MAVNEVDFALAPVDGVFQGSPHPVDTEVQHRFGTHPGGIASEGM